MELIIVIVVIGILAAIILVAYSGISSKAKESAVQSDLSNIAKQLGIYKARNGQYPTSVSEMKEAGVKVSQSNYSVDRNNVYYCRSADKQTYAVGVEAVTGKQYYLVDGSIKATTGLSAAHTCDQAEPPDGTGAVGIASGYVWHVDTSTGGWNNWIK